MAPVWAQRREELLSDCSVSPDVFHQMVDRLGEFVMPYQQALETEADPHSMHLYLQGLLSHLPRKNAEEIAAWVNVERQVIQDFIGTAAWDHRRLVDVLVGQVAERLGEPDGIIAFDPSSFPKRGAHSVGVKRQWCGHRGKVDNCQVGVFMGYVSRHDHALLDFRLSLPEEWARDEQRRQACHVPPEVRYHTRHEQLSLSRLNVKCRQNLEIQYYGANVVTSCFLSAWTKIFISVMTLILTDMLRTELLLAETSTTGTSL